CHQYNSYPRTF
nr:immunoglobulin light chain junction region [Macaca mulatta]MOX47696.1 immunoglobulin light chain junction region [Macaca mulatta]MOX47806.1 immunoglobulin light chain junction region [Macaca mulatta]MOX47818.1 immunoglobulin light chain junction region [Macaca mulatta]MOX47865.1 immunoglobulin light chain junction region [Macaca mulatta]